jgi:PIN domain nuclease of toxin-antitoxin system
VSAASGWEIAIKHQLGKLRKVADLVSDFTSRIESEGFHLLSISAEHGIRAGMLPGLHQDPFDRMLIAQAQTENVPIVSNEAVRSLRRQKVMVVLRLENISYEFT